MSSQKNNFAFVKDMFLNLENDTSFEFKSKFIVYFKLP